MYIEYLENEELVKEMYDKDLNFIYEIIKVIYSINKDKRFVLLKQENNLYTFVYEMIYKFDDEELKYQEKKATWMEPCCSMSNSLYGSLSDLENDILKFDEYNKYFK